MEDEDKLTPEEAAELIEDFKRFFRDFLKEMKAAESPIAHYAFLVATMDVVKRDPFDDEDVMNGILKYLEDEVTKILETPNPTK